MSALSSPALTAGPITRVLVVDDSALIRGLITRQLSSDPSIQVVGTAANGQLALAELDRQAVDVVVLDIEMPVMDGLTALGEIVRRHRGLQVIMASTLTRRNAEVSLQALRMGAADYVPKPEGGKDAAEAFKRELLAKVQGLGRAARMPRPAPRPVPMVATPVAARSSPPSVLAIGASTGGPAALLRLFEALRGAVGQPILLTQHMPATFTTLLAEQLSRAGERPCAEGRDGEPVVPGRCYVAPGGWHMTVAASDRGPVIRLDQEPPENFCRPAVDPMMRSAARTYGAGVLGVVLTGMGSDGAAGCDAIIQAGGRFIVQDQASSVVWGMPGAASAGGQAERVLSLDAIGPWLRTATATPR